MNDNDVRFPVLFSQISSSQQQTLALSGAVFLAQRGGGAAETINERFATSLENFSGRSKKDNFSQSPHRFNL